MSRFTIFSRRPDGSIHEVLGEVDEKELQSLADLVRWADGPEVLAEFFEAMINGQEENDGHREDRHPEDVDRDDGQRDMEG